MRLHHVHFYVDDASLWRDRFLRLLQCLSNGQILTQNPTPYTHSFQGGGLRLHLSEPQTATDPIAQFLSQRSPGIGALGVMGVDPKAIASRLARSGGQLVGNWLCSPLGIRHLLLPAELEPTAQPLGPQLDHLVLNVPQGQLEPTVQWYEAVFGLARQQSFAIETGQSGLRSQVLRHPVTGLTLPINEPTSANSQIQDFLNHHGGSGFQHLAIRVPRLIPTVQALRQAGLDFLTVPHHYYAAQADPMGQDNLSRAEWQQLRSQQILLDRPSTGGLLLQIFSQPIFAQPTFFWEFIERRSQARGFGEGNFLALFRAIEQAQTERNTLVIP
ncbi:MAG: 4-hydroxyphenylpyruvate dioxygenase family protein [Spirulinaceae cyanobacterium]